MESTSLGSQECIPSLLIPEPPETSTPTSTTNSNYQEPCITTEFPWLGRQAKQQTSQVIQISTKLGQGTHAHYVADHLYFSVSYSSLPPHDRPRQMIVLGQNRGRPCREESGVVALLRLGVPEPVSAPLLAPRVLGSTVCYLRPKPFLYSSGPEQTGRRF